MKQTMQHTRHRLATLLLLVVAMIIPQVANAIIEKPSKGDGTKESPYLIENYNNFHWFCYEVNENGNGGICGKLMNNINLQSSSRELVIGRYYNHPFWGEFDGNNKTISGVIRPDDLGYGPSPNYYEYAGGVFGCIKVPSGTTAVVKNLTVEGEMNISVTNRVYYIGGVIGIAYGDVNLSNITSKVNVTITNDESDAHCGGVVGSVEWFGNGNYSGNLTVSNCVNYGTINVACGEICGGVVGYIRNGSITDCLNVGDITNSEDGYTAGILGYVNSTGCTLSRCLNLGTVTNTKKAANAYSVYYVKDGKSSNIGEASKLYYKSGVGGTALKATEVSDEQLKSGEVAYLLSQGTWGQSLGNNSVNDAYPYPDKTAYQVYQSGSNYYNNITSTIPTGDFTTTIETTAQYITNQTRIGDTRSFTVKPTVTTGGYIEKVTHNGSTLYDKGVNDNTWTYSYTVALNNNFEITVADFSCSTTLNQSTIGTAINLADNTLGSTETFTATPKLGYYITGATINGETIIGTVVSGKTDGTKSFSFTVKKSNTVVINTAAIACTTTLNQSTTTPNLADNQIGSTETFTVTPKAGYYITGATINGETIIGTVVSGKTDGTKSFSFTVKKSNTVVINTAAIACTTTLNQSTTTLNLADNQIGSTATFTATPKAGYYITGAIINGETVNGIDVSGKSDGTKSFSFTVKESNAATINTVAIGYTKPTGDNFTTNLPDNLADKQIGSIVNFLVMGICKADVSYNSTVLTPSRTLWDGSKEYMFTVATENVISITNITQHAYDTNGFCTICGSGHPATLDSDGYYNIADAGHLYWFAEKVNNGNTIINAKLTADIVVNEDVLDDDGELIGDGTGFRTWTPIGIDTDGQKYEGTFDGQGHTISGLYINDEEKSVVGLFCATGTNSVIKNVGIIDSYFRADQHAAGICGSNGGVIDNCYSGATCIVSDEGVGGIVSWNGGTIRNCYNVGKITGQRHGAICANNTNGTTTNCYYLEGTADAGIYYGSGDAIEMTAEQFASGEVAWLLNGETAEGELTWYQNLGDNADTYPVLDSNHGTVHKGYDICLLVFSNNSNLPTTPTGHLAFENGFCTKCDSGHPATLDSDGYYEIADAGHLYWFAQQVNSGENTINAVLTANIVVNTSVLTADGSLSDNNSTFRVWTPIGNNSKTYMGTFDGQGHTISGLYVNEAKKDNVGLFCYINCSAKIMNVGVTDSYFRGNNHVGGVCGYANSNCSLTNCYNTGTVSGNNYVGGVCGYARDGSLTNCYNTGTVKGELYVGGVCGYSFENSLSHCDNTGAVSGNAAGGVCGYARDGSLTNCYNTGTVKGELYVGGVCGFFNTTACSLTNCYYLDGSCEQGVGVNMASSEATAMTDDQFKSGEVAWLLNGSEAGESPAWRQTIDEDKYPVLDAKKGIVIYSTQIGLNPIIRPTAGTLVGASDVYNFAGIEGNKVYGIPQTGTLAAGHPYVFKSDYEYVSFVPSDEAVTDDTPTCGLTGVLDPAGVRVYGQNNTAGEDVSIVFTATALKYANPNGNTVKYGKCYINAEECFITSEPVAMAKSIANFGAGGTTGIDGTDAATDDHEGKAYNPQGVQVGKDYKGVVIVNGRKMVRK